MRCIGAAGDELGVDGRLRGCFLLRAVCEITMLQGKMCLNVDVLRWVGVSGSAPCPVVWRTWCVLDAASQASSFSNAYPHANWPDCVSPGATYRI